MPLTYWDARWRPHLGFAYSAIGMVQDAVRINGLKEGNTLPLTNWESFFVIVGSSAAALTGLQFVVIALIAESRTRATTRDIAAFGSPTVVHFCSALFISATLSAPWPSVLGPAITIAGCGLAGGTYAIVVARRTRQTGYKAVFEDKLWHIALPLVAYTALLVAGIVLRRVTIPSLFVIAATTLLLVFIGIHNAWDTVIYVTVSQSQSPDESKDTHGVRQTDRQSSSSGGHQHT
jgi:hypothetical protein